MQGAAHTKWAKPQIAYRAGVSPGVAFVAFVDAIDKSHRTAHCGDKGPAGNGPGTARPTRVVCYLPKAKGGHAKHVETGQVVQDAHSRRSS